MSTLYPIFELIEAASEFKCLLDEHLSGCDAHGADVRDSETYRRAAEVLSRFMGYPKLPEIYYTDSYPRKGCRVVVEVPNRSGDRWGFSIYAPNQPRPIEAYSFKDFEQVLMAVRFWSSGCTIPPEMSFKYRAPFNELPSQVPDSVQG